MKGRRHVARAPLLLFRPQFEESSLGGAEEESAGDSGSVAALWAPPSDHASLLIHVCRGSAHQPSFTSRSVVSLPGELKMIFFASSSWASQTAIASIAHLIAQLMSRIGPTGSAGLDN